VGPVWVVDLETPGVRGEFHRPPALVDRVMMPAAQRDQIAEISTAAVVPFVNVMGLAPGKRTITPLPRARTVQGPKTLPLAIGSRAVPATDIDWDATLVDHHSLQNSVAGQTGDRFRRQP
jgi:hypothetical protein